MRYTTRIIVPPKIRRSGQPGGGGAYRPQTLGVRKSYGFDDPFGLATPGHIGAALRHPDFAPVFAQRQFGGMEAGGRTPQDAMSTVVRAVGGARFRLPWGADANLVREPQEVEDAAAAGFTYYTLDPSELIRHEADDFSSEQLTANLQTLVEDGDLPEDWSQNYVDRTIDLPGGQHLVLTLASLQRVAVKYARAIRHCARLSEAVARANPGRPFELEVFFAASHTVATTLEHLFIGLELEARGVRITTLTLRLIDPAADAYAAPDVPPDLETHLYKHAAVAEFCGPYKLGFHNVSLFPSCHPIIGRCCRDAFHVKTSHLSYLEALRVVLLADPELFERVAVRIQINPSDLAQPSDQETTALVTHGPTGETFLTKSAALLAQSEGDEPSMQSAVVATLERHADIYQEQLTALFDKRLSLLKAG